MHISINTLIPTFLTLVTLSSACTKPTTKPVIDNSRPFGIQIENKKYPAIHNKNMNLWSAGGGDQHLYLSPAGSPAFNLQLISGSITQNQIHTVINGEYTPEDNTTKMFMTDRGDPRAIFNVVYGCNPDTDALQLELVLASRGTTPLTPGGHICVRTASQGRWEFRYSGPGNTKDMAVANRPCMPITMRVYRP